MAGKKLLAEDMNSAEKIERAIELLKGTEASWLIIPREEVDRVLEMNEIVPDADTCRAVASALQSDQWLSEQIIIAAVDAARSFQEMREAVGGEQ